MLKVTVGNNVERREIAMDYTSSVGDAFREVGIDVGTRQVNINGIVVDDLDKPLSSYNLEDGVRVFINAIAKLNGN